MNLRVAPSARRPTACFFLSPFPVRGVELVNYRRVISGIVHVLKSGCRWCDCPPEYGPPTTMYNSFVRWAGRGLWENLFRELARCGRSADTQMIDSAHVKAHRSASVVSSGRADSVGNGIYQGRLVAQID
jgi:transposase